MKIRMSLLAAACGLALAACGGETPAPAEPAAATPAAEAPVAAAAPVEAPAATVPEAAPAVAAGPAAVVSDCSTTIESNDAMQFNAASSAVPDSMSSTSGGTDVSPFSYRHASAAVTDPPPVTPVDTRARTNRNALPSALDGRSASCAPLTGVTVPRLAHVPAYAGAASWRAVDGVEHPIALAQRFVPNEGDGWSWTLARLDGVRPRDDRARPGRVRA